MRTFTNRMLRQRANASMLCWVLAALLSPGCGATREHRASDQLLLSDAVDRSVAQIDFSPLSGTKVYLDTQYLQPIEEAGFVNADYVIGALRQQIFSSGCLLQDVREDAEVILEARMGALGKDGHDVSYGLPASNALSSAAQLLPNTPPLPPLPELSLAKRRQDLAAAKLGIFAYDAETKRPVWKSGTSVAHSTAKYRWILGAGPFQSGTIYEGGLFAGRRLKTLSLVEKSPPSASPDEAFRQARLWRENLPQRVPQPADASASDVALASHEVPAESDDASSDDTVESE